MEYGENQPPSVADAGERVRDDLSLLLEAARRRGDELWGQGREMVEQNPIAAMGIAFGLGYVLSGALFSRTTARLAKLGARFYLTPLLRGAIGAGLLEALGLGAQRDATEPGA